MHDIVLATLNARYWHSAFGLRYLLANMKSLRQQTTILEFGLREDCVDMAAQILAQRPKIVGIGVYIWNAEPVTRLVADLKRIAPEVTIVLGGPEVSHETQSQAVVQFADFVICGEADLAFPRLCEQLLGGGRPAEKVIQADLPQLADLELPYGLYTDEDIRNRVIYVEASRGCPFRCEFCLSALEIPVRMAELDVFLEAMQRLIDRGARQFKFVDRTFNLNPRVSSSILRFFLDRIQEGMFLHFEMVPDRLPEGLKELIAQFPAGTLQFEIGVQTFNEQVGRLISRPQDNQQLEENFRFLRTHTDVHIHSDLIVGLPGESLASFGKGFDRLIALDPQEIQVGMLKRLRGSPITRHDLQWQMVYSEHPPYEILSTKLVPFEAMQRLRRFSRYWDLIGNSGNFVASRNLIWKDRSPFASFMRFSEWLFEREHRVHGISLIRLAERLFEFLETEGADPQQTAEVLWQDYLRGGRHDKPQFLRRFDLPAPPSRSAQQGPPRQSRHAG